MIGNPIERRTVLGTIGIANTAVLRKLGAGWSITTPSGEAGRGRGAAITRSRHRLSLLDLPATGGPGHCPSAPTRPRLPSSRDRQTDRKAQVWAAWEHPHQTLFIPSASEGEWLYLSLRELSRLSWCEWWTMSYMSSAHWVLIKHDLSPPVARCVYVPYGLKLFNKSIRTAYQELKSIWVSRYVWVESQHLWIEGKI